jgi:transposase
VIAPSLIPVRAGDRVKTDRRDAQKLITFYRGGLLRFVAPPTPETEGLRDLLRCRDDIRCARTAARHRVAKQLLRHGHVFREGKKAWTIKHQAWVHRQQLADRLAQEALVQMLIHLDGIDRQLATLDAQLEQIAGQERWGWQVSKLRAFRGIGTLTALGLIVEIGDFARFSHPRELASWLGITPNEYSSGEQRHRGTSPAAATVTPADCSSRPRGTTATRPAARAADLNLLTGRGRRRPACFTATATSPATGNARPS